MTLTDIRISFTREVDYPVLVRPGLLAELPEQLRLHGLGPKVMILTDELVNELYAQDTEKLLQESGYDVNIVELPAGEKYKVYNTVGKVYNILKAARVDRGTTIVALGGGVVGDLAGFVAATWQRGLPLVQVPTTLLAQVDSSVGGKVAVNHLGLKNLIGAFHHPELVLVDPILLESLPEDQYRAGLAEVIKTALLAGPEFWALLVEQIPAIQRRDAAVLTDVIERCLAFKARVVSLDPEDHGERRVLNLGHTIGHAIEEIDGKEYSHGEAVGIGLLFVLGLSTELGLPQEVAATARMMLRAFGLPTRAPGLDLDRLLQLISRDKKARDGVTNWVLLPQVGQPLITSQLPAGWQNRLAALVEPEEN